MQELLALLRYGVVRLVIHVTVSAESDCSCSTKEPRCTLRPLPPGFFHPSFLFLSPVSSFLLNIRFSSISSCLALCCPTCSFLPPPPPSLHVSIHSPTILPSVHFLVSFTSCSSSLAFPSSSSSSSLPPPYPQALPSPPPIT